VSNEYLGGQNVQDIRDATDARIRVSEHIQGASDRVLFIQGEAESIAAVSIGISSFMPNQEG
jgi:hypothetical protein